MRRLSDSDISRASSSSTSTYSTSGDLGSSRSSRSRRSFNIAGGGDGEAGCMTCFGPRRPKASGRPLDMSSSSAEALSVSYLNDSTRSSCTVSDSYSSAGIAGDAFSMAEIRKATGNFSASNIIGQGQFGTIYKGTLPDGTMVAIKRADKQSSSSRSASSEFKNEIRTLSKIEHLNLVRCFGYLEQDDEKIIVFEYVGNGNLRDHLDGLRGVELEMAARIEIAIGVAHAVTYLHSYSDHPIIHRNIKASNVLTTENLRVKVSDFGFAHLAPNSPDVTHIITQVKGTEGYIDPEYIQTYQLTEKSDVYSFGVLLVELVTGRHPIEAQRHSKERLTVRWAMKKYKSGDSVMTMDPRLRRNPASVMAVDKLLGLAYQCLAKSRKARPPMKQCTEVLWEIRKSFMDISKQSLTSTPFNNSV